MWQDVLRRPADFTDGPAADRWFAAVADALLNRAALVAGGRPHRILEVEAYYHGPGHEDPFAHRDPVQLHLGRWYFHRTRGAYRGGSFKGVDLAFGDGTAYGGFILRGLETPEGGVVDGPSLLVDHLLKATGMATVADLDAAIGERPAWHPDVPLRLAEIDRVERPVVRTARVGLSLKYRKPKPDDPALAFVLRQYRYLTDPRRTAKGKLHTVLALLADGLPEAEAAALTGCPRGTVRRYAEGFRAGAAETDPAPFYGTDWSTADLARLHGFLWRGENSATPSADT